VRLGFEVAQVAIVGDRPGDLEGALRFAAEAGSR
jgi:molybdopterin-biosynthesis enzyme MoeA-like protein